MNNTKQFTNKFIPLFVLAPFVVGAGIVSAVTVTNPDFVASQVAVSTSAIKHTPSEFERFSVPVIVKRTEGATGLSTVRGLQVTVSDVRDSRCSRGVTCIWAGEVRATLTIQTSDQSPPVVFTGIRVDGTSVQYMNWNVSLSLMGNKDGTVNPSTVPYIFLVKFSKINSETLSATSTPVAMGTVQGKVLAGPACPVMRQDVPCPDRPLETTLALYDADKGQLLKTIKSGKDGTFTVVLASGNYRIEGNPTPGAPILPRISPVEFSVSAGKITQVTVNADTGIR